jgi:hypothetical protein
MICPACNKLIGRFHKTPNGFHRDCFEHWEKGYTKAMEFCNNENKIAGFPLPDQLYIKRNQPKFSTIKDSKMIKKEVKKYWISNEELLKVFGFKENALLMDIEIFKNMNNPLGYQIQGMDLFVEHSIETNENNSEEVITISKDKNKGKKEIKKKAKGKK